MDSSSDDVDPEDFWGESEDLPKVSDRLISASRSPNKDYLIDGESPSKFILKQFNSITNDFLKQKMNASIESLRKDNQDQIKSVKLIVRNSTRKELKSAVDEIRAQFEKEVFMIKQDHDRMKDEISKKNQEIMLIAQYMIDQEAMITQNRLQSLIKIEEKVKTNDTQDEEKKLKKDLNLLKVQIEGMKEAIKEYSNETIKSADKVKQLDEEIDQLRSRHRQELKELEIYLEDRVAKAIQQRDQIRESFENYKKSGWSELEEKEDVCFKQRETIAALQNELKKAKGILNNPKLKLRVHERLKDYIDEYEIETNESPPPPTTTKTPFNTTRRSKTNERGKSHERRHAHTSKGHYEQIPRLGSLNDSVELPKFKIKKIEINDFRVPKTLETNF